MEKRTSLLCEISQASYATLFALELKSGVVDLWSSRIKMDSVGWGRARCKNFQPIDASGYSGES